MYKYIKCFLDYIISFAFLPVFFFITLILFIIVKIEDNGPVFYIDKRLGYKGQEFKMIKFRSMKVNAPDIRLEDGSTYNSNEDPRQTKIGRLLRKSSLDELPQILNVLLGQMSIIGPRPDTVDQYVKYSEQDKKRLRVKPGITGYSQAYFRNSINSTEKIRNDVFYSENISFFLDLKIFFRTIKIIIKRDQIYSK